MPKIVKLNPNKLLNSKWTAVTPTNKEKHFMVTKLILQDQPESPITHVEIEAVHSKRIQILLWRELTDNTVWLQGWL